MELTGSDIAATPPPELAIRTFATAFARRAPGEAAAPETLAVRAYRAQMDELSELLLELGPEDWSAPTLAGYTVHELLGHLLAVEGYTSLILGVAPPPGLAAFVPPAGTEDDHRAMSTATIDDHVDTDPEALIAEWRALVDANLAALVTLTEDDLERRVQFHHLDISLRSMLGVRVFEVWTHTDDVRRATGRELRAPAPDHLVFMSNLAVGALPLGLLLSGIDDPGRTVKVVLTGAGGGEWLQPLTVGAEAGDPDATLVADVVDFCRLAAQRLSPAELRHERSGDDHAIDDVLVGAAVFAA